MIKAFWREMGRDDFADPALGDAVAILPVAAIEQHGPHLPTGTDAILAEGYIDAVIGQKPDDLPLIFLPVQQVGWSEEHLDGAGTLTSNWQHLLPVWMDLCLSVKRAGVKRIIIINSHGGNVPLMDILIQDLRVHHGMVASATNWLRLGYPDGLFDPEEIAYGIHGGAVESSMMLALRPDLVLMEKAGDFASRQQGMVEQNRHLHFYGRKSLGWMATDLNREGVVGNASLASAKKGRALIDHIAGQFVVYAREVAKVAPPAS
ncbi:creatininase family protein [uncultured Cohaesibacter sp.]|uniref:creatininase family protein n=1 Tax=uncultured Cohaesibacter sp. TaxID=1002546 RepID=UPI0029C7646C|nr:creatininase family protein [uncultured Cohaesibacter sp.]